MTSPTTRRTAPPPHATARPARRSLLAWVAATLLVAPGVAAQSGAWEGAFVLSGSRWPARLEFLDGRDAPRVTLDLPTLGYVGEPLEARRLDDGAVEVQAPFGLGAFRLGATDDGGLEVVSDGPVVLRLERAADQERPWTTEEVTFDGHDGTTLSGTLYLPRSGAPHAGVVVLHGASISGRRDWGYRGWGPAYASMGLATLVYDKRPGGGRADLAVLAADARAAHAFLRGRSEVRTEATGLAGGSQAGWLAPAVAVDTGEVAFLVLTSCPAVTPRVQDLQALRNGMVDDGLDPAWVEEAVAYAEFMFWVARTGLLWDAFSERVARAAAQPWGDYVNQPRSLDDLAWWTRNMDFGGEKLLRLVRCPVLALYGEADWVVPPAENADRLVRALVRGGNEDVRTEVFPEADHRLEVPLVQGAGEVRWPRLAPGLYEAIAGWLAEHGLREDDTALEPAR